MCRTEFQLSQPAEANFAPEHGFLRRLYVDLNKDEETTALPLAADLDFALPERVPPSTILPTANNDAAAPEEGDGRTGPATPSAAPQQRGPGPFAAANMNGGHNNDEIQDDVEYEEEVAPSGMPNGLPAHPAN